MNEEKEGLLAMYVVHEKDKAFETLRAIIDQGYVAEMIECEIMDGKAPEALVLMPRKSFTRLVEYVDKLHWSIRAEIGPKSLIVSRSMGIFMPRNPPTRHQNGVHMAKSGKGYRTRFHLLVAVLAIGLAGSLTWAGPLFPYQTPLVGVSPREIIVVDINDDGAPDLAVANKTSNDVSILMNLGDGTFGTESRFPAGTNPQSIVAGDFNRDGRADLAVANHGSADVTILLGTGGGAFESGGTLGVGGGPVAIAGGDFNHDGCTDLAVACGSSRDLRLFVCAGNATFTAQAAVSLGGSPTVMVGADLNGDANDDLLIGVSDPNSLVAFLGLGGGLFGPARVTGLGSTPQALAVGNLNGDPRRDVVVSNKYFQGLDRHVSVFLGLGNGTFTGVTSPLQEAIGPADVALRDLNADGKDDLVALGRYLTIYPGRGDGTFQAPVVVSVGTQGASVVAADLDGDGDPDLALTDDYFDYKRGAVDLVLNEGSLRFTGLSEHFTNDYQNLSGATGDFDEDGYQDIAVGNASSATLAVSGAHVFRSNGDGTFTDGGRFEFGPEPRTRPWSMVAADLNEDGHLDLAVTDVPEYGSLYRSPGVSVLFGRGDGTFVESTHTGTGGFPVEMAAGDFNHDGHIDLALADQDGDAVVLLGQGNGAFEPPARYETGPNPWTIVVSDFDGDGRQDLAVGSSETSEISILLGNGDGSFRAGERFGSAPYLLDLGAGDFNGDGRQDLVAARSGYFLDGISDDMTIFLGNGDGSFGPPSATDGGASPGSVAVEDFNADGNADIAVDDEGSNVEAVLLGRGDGTFASPKYFGIGGSNKSPFGNITGDFNNDHRPDIVSIVYDTGAVVLMNTGPFGDTDHDEILDAHDTCPEIPDPVQADSDGDGSGDACQPGLVLSGITEDGGETLEVDAHAEDPQGDPLSGRIEVFETSGIPVQLQDTGAFDCSTSLSPDGSPGPGLAFSYAGVGEPVLFDIRLVLGCPTYGAEIEMAPGACSDPLGPFENILFLDRLPSTSTLCVRSTLALDMQYEWKLGVMSPSALSIETRKVSPAFRVAFHDGLPSVADLASLWYRRSYRLRITVTDGTTRPVSAQQEFQYQGESLLVIGLQAPPEAVIGGPTSVECSGPAGGLVTLDGSGSRDPAPEGEISGYEWFLDAGLPSETLLGTDPILSVTLPIGEHLVTLRVTSAAGLPGTAQTVISVQDTTPPVLLVTVDRPVLWPANHRMVHTHPGIQVADLCDPGAIAVLSSAVSSEPDDAEGEGDGRTTDDIEGAEIGGPDDAIQLRAERSAAGQGRQYQLTYVATDASGNHAAAVAVVTVPHDLGASADPLAIRAVHGETAGSVQFA